MQPKRENQPTFFDLAVQQRGSANRVLETITREVDFTAAEERVSYDFWSAISGQSGGTSYINNAANAAQALPTIGTIPRLNNTRKIWTRMPAASNCLK